MGSKRLKLSSKAALPFKTSNKLKRQQLQLKRKKAIDSTKRDERFKRKREEDQDPHLREQRLKHNIPVTIDKKRVWDEIAGDIGNGIGVSVDTERIKRMRTQEELQRTKHTREVEQSLQSDEEEEDHDSMLDSDSDVDSENAASAAAPSHYGITAVHAQRSPSPTQSTTSTNLDCSPEALAAKFPTLFYTENLRTPKILITTSLNSTLHSQCEVLTTLFPNSNYVPRSGHKHAHKFSVREICEFAVNRHYSTVFFLREDQKKPSGLDIVHLPKGPMFHFSIANWVEGKKLPGHGNPSNHSPELILNNFHTPLGLLTAHLFRSLFPPQPDLQGRQVVTLHNQRDYIFVRRHRYVFREKKGLEKNVVGSDGKVVKGVEGIRAGLQELGPRFTLKLRRVDKGLGRAGGDIEWEWKAGMEKQRTRFQL